MTVNRDAARLAARTYLFAVVLNFGWEMAQAGTCEESICG